MTEEGQSNGLVRWLSVANEPTARLRLEQLLYLLHLLLQRLPLRFERGQVLEQVTDDLLNAQRSTELTPKSPPAATTAIISQWDR